MTELNEMAGFPVTAKEANEFWKQKVPVTGEVFHVNDESRTRAFTVAQTNSIDQVFKIKTAIGKALAEGGTFNDFVTDENVAQVVKECDLTDWHLATIYRTNTQSAYAAGRYAQMQKVKKLRPYWRYVAVNDSRTRTEHAALNNVVYPADDPFWEVNYPPNGFNCRCTVVSMSEKEVKKAGLTISHIDLEAGEKLVPINAAFGNNPGKNWMSGLENNCVTAIDRDVPADLQTVPEKFVRNYKESDLLQLPESLKNADDQEQQKWFALKFLNEFGIKDLNGHKIIILPGVNYPVVISKQLIMDKGKIRPNGTIKPPKLKANKSGRGKYLKILADSIKKPHEIHVGLLKNGHAGVIVTTPYRVEGGTKQACFSLFSMGDIPENLPSNFNPDKTFSGTTVFVPDEPNYIKDNTKTTPATKQTPENKRERIWREK